MIDRFLKFPQKLHQNRYLILVMARREFAQRYVGTGGGWMWAIMHPVALVLVFWVVFSLGFKAVGRGNIPFVLYFVAGLAPWLTFSEALHAGVTSITSNAHLVKKVVFPTELLPAVYLLAALFGHVVAVLCVVAVLYGHGYSLSMWALQLPYYFAGLAVLVLGLSLVLAALQAFHRDVQQATSVLLNAWFWATPIVWTTDLLPTNFHWVVTINPVAYIVKGYRDSLIYGVPFWDDVAGAGTFWGMTLIIFGLGAAVFRRLKHEFADVL